VQSPDGNEGQHHPMGLCGLGKDVAFLIALKMQVDNTCAREQNHFMSILQIYMG